MEQLKRLEEENSRLKEVATKFEELWKNTEHELKRLEEENLSLKTEAESDTMLEEENSRLREQAKKFEDSWNKTVAEYEQKSREVDQLLGLIENLKADITSKKIELQEQVDSVNFKLAQVESNMQQMKHRLGGFGGRLTSAEGKIGEMVTQIPSSTVEIVESEEAKCRKAADYIESRLKGIQKEHMEHQNMALAVMSVYLAHLGLYAMLFTLGSLLFQLHVSCEWAEKIGISLVVGFATVLGSQVYSYDCKVRVIGRGVKALIRKLAALREEAKTLTINLPHRTEAERRAEAGTPLTSNLPTGTSSWLASIYLRGFMTMRHLYCRTPKPDDNHVQDQFVNRVEILARRGGLEKGLSKFACGFRCQMIIPAAFIFIVFGGLMFSFYEYCDKASKAPLSSILAT